MVEGEINFWNGGGERESISKLMNLEPYYFKGMH